MANVNALWQNNPIVDSINLANGIHRSKSVYSPPMYQNKLNSFYNPRSNKYNDRDANPQPSFTHIDLNTKKITVRLTLKYNCQQIPDIYDVQRRINADPIINRNIGKTYSSVHVNRFLCTNNQQELLADYDFYVYNDILASDFDVVLNDQLNDNGITNLEAFHLSLDKIRPSLLRSIGLNRFGVQNNIEIILEEDVVDDTIIDENEEETITNIIEETINKLSEMDDQSSLELSNIIDEYIKNLLKFEEFVSAPINSVDTIEGRNALINRSRKFATDILSKASVDIKELKISELLAQNLDSTEVDDVADVNEVIETLTESVTPADARDDIDFAIEESGIEGVFDDDVVGSILESGQLDQFSEEVAESIKTPQPEQPNEGDVVELLNSLSEGSDEQENVLKTILSEIAVIEDEDTEDIQENDAETREIEAITEDDKTNDLKDVLSEFMNEDQAPEIEVTATEIVHEILSELIDTKNDNLDNVDDTGDRLSLDFEDFDVRNDDLSSDNKDELKETLSNVVKVQLPLATEATVPADIKNLEKIRDQMRHEHDRKEPHSFFDFESQSIDKNIEVLKNKNQTEIIAKNLNDDDDATSTIRKVNSVETDIPLVLAPMDDLINRNLTALTEVINDAKPNQQNQNLTESYQNAVSNLQTVLNEQSYGGNEVDELNGLHRFTENMVETVLSLFS